LNTINNDLDEFYKLLELRDFDKAEVRILKLLSYNPKDYLLLNNYAVVLYSKKDYSRAVDQFLKVIDSNKDFSEAYYNIATIYNKLSKFSEAIEYFKKALTINADYFDARFNLATSFINSNKFDEAIDSLKQCLRLKPNDCEIYNNLGTAYLKKDMLDDSIFNFNKCIHLQFDFVRAYNNLGIALHKKKKYREAIFILQKGIEIEPKFKDLYINLANTLRYVGRYMEAVEILKNYLEDNKKKEHEILTLLGGCLCEVGEISEGLKLFQESSLIEPNEILNYEQRIFFMNYLENINFNEYFASINKLRNHFIKYHFNHKRKVNLDTEKIKKKIRVGFVTADFRDHAVGFQLFDVIKNLSENVNFELYAYYNYDEQDVSTEKFKKFFKKWEIIKNVKDSDVINIIRLDNIQILIDLAGFSEGGRLQVFFNKPAPIQISWAGYLASTGMLEIDYVIADKYSVTSNEEKQFVEKIWRLNNTWSVIKPENDIILNQELPMTKNNYVTFGSFNEIKKINKKVIELWSRILRNSHNSKLVLISKKFNEQKFKDRFTNFFIKNGVNLNQLLFEGEQERRKLLIKYNYIDIALDTFPYNGGTTSLEAAWMCVPILVMKGKSFLSKCGESINFSLGMDEWICDDGESYVKKALFFSKDLKKLQETKDYLIKNRSNFSIFDGKKLSNELSHAFQEMVNINNSKC
jgi:predicted O-linked N-acetylglucosamine transferase (SPINDLY family)